MVNEYDLDVELACIKLHVEYEQRHRLSVACNGKIKVVLLLFIFSSAF